MTSEVEALRRALEDAREKLAQLADQQADQRGDYLYRGQPDASLLTAIREIDKVLLKSTEGR